MIRAYQLMISRSMLLQQYQSHDHELARVAAGGGLARVVAFGKEGR
jgi:hypothetical protein